MKGMDEASYIVEAIKRVGPRNCSLISRMTGIPIGTVRYKIYEQLKKKGVRVQVSVDYSKLGLARNWVALNFSDKCSELAPRILERLSSIGYLTYYGRVVPQGNYFSLVALPPKAKAEYRKFLNGLIDLNILTSYKMDELDWICFLSMRPEYYDFSTGTWNINWETLNQSKVLVKGMGDIYVGEPMADKVDLLILTELQLDSTVSIMEIARKLKMKFKKVNYHFLEHVVRRELIMNYIIRWQAGIEDDGQYSTLSMAIEFRDLTRGELSSVQEVFHKLPFGWFDALSSDRALYLVYVSLPLTQYVNLLNYLRRTISRYNQKFKVSLIDASCSQGYTIPCEMFDEKQGWTFDAEKTLKEVGHLIHLTKEIKAVSFKK